MLVIIIVKYLRPVCKRGAPLRTAVGMLFATGHSSFLRSTKMARSTRKHGLTCLEYGENRKSNSSHRYEIMSGLCKTIFCFHWLQKIRESAAHVCVFSDILWSRVHV